MHRVSAWDLISIPDWHTLSACGRRVVLGCYGGNNVVESQMDDFELIEILPTFLARRWKRTIETLDPVRHREELVATLELFLRVLCAVALADYISGPRTDEEAESEIRGLQGKRGGPSLGDWRRLSDALLKALSRRTPTSDSATPSSTGILQGRAENCPHRLASSPKN